MSLPIKASRVSAAVTLQRAGRRSYKELAREFGVSVNAVKLWIRNGIPARRRLQILAALDTAIDDGERRLAQLREERKAHEYAEQMAARGRVAKLGAGAQGDPPTVRR